MNLENIFKVVKYKNYGEDEVDSYIVIEKQENNIFFYKTLINELGRVVYEDSDIKRFKFDSIFHRKMLEKIEDLTYINEKLSNFKFLKPFEGSLYYNDMIDYLYCNWGDSIAKTIRNKNNITTVDVNYISVCKDGFKFLPTGKKLILNDEGGWSDKNRQSMKFSKLIRKLLKNPKYFNDSDYELFSNRIKSYIGIYGDEHGNGKYELQVIEGEELRKAYLEDNCSRILCSGSSSHPLQSCMRYSKCQPYLDLYANNPDIVKMLVLKDDQNLIGGRALLWKNGKKIYMDRIYGSDAIIQIFKSWAIKNNCIYKNYQGSNSPFDMLGTERIRNSKIKIPINLDDVEYFPYLDTMYYYDFENKHLTNKEPKGKCFVLRSTSGSKEIRRNYNKFLDEYTGQLVRDDIHHPVRVDYIMDGNEINMVTSYANTCRVYDFVDGSNNITTYGSSSRFLSRDVVMIGSRFYRKDDVRIQIIDGLYSLKRIAVSADNSILSF